MESVYDTAFVHGFANLRGGMCYAMRKGSLYSALWNRLALMLLTSVPIARSSAGCRATVPVLLAGSLSYRQSKNVESL